MDIPFQRILSVAPAFVIFATCISIAAAARAEDTVIYKWTDKNGVVTYSESKPPDSEGQNVTTISVPTLPPEQQRATNRALLELDKREDASYQARKRRQTAADAKIDAAIKRLQQAEQRLAAGSQVQGGDRVGNVGGYTRLRGSYFDRIARLQGAVDQAKQDLDAAYAARDQL